MSMTEKAMQVKVRNLKGEEVGATELPREVFGAKPRGGLLHEAAIKHLANQRRWTAHTKTRSEVSGGGRKPWRQKHTGRARAGSIRSPLWRKGGVVFGPRHVDPELKRVKMPRRKSRLALAQALSLRAQDGGLKVIDALAVDGAKTRQVAAFLASLGAGGKPLVALEQHDKSLVTAGRNIPGLRIVLASQLNAYEVLRCSSLIMTRVALEKIRSRWS